MAIVPVQAGSMLGTSYIETYVSQKNPSTNYNQSQSMVVSYDPSNQKQEFILLKFDMAGIPSNAIITKATLKFWQTSSSGAANVTLKVQRPSSDWGSTTTWNTKPQLVGTYGTLSVPNNNNFREVDIVVLAQSWVDGSIANRGVAIVVDSALLPAVASSRTFASGEVADYTQQPSLTVGWTTPSPTPTPKPTIKPVSLTINGTGGVLIYPSIKPIGTPLVVDLSRVDLSNSTKPTISDIVATNITQDQATITWKTNTQTSSWVFYGKVTNGDTFDRQSGQNDRVQAHSVTLSGLSANTKYSYKVLSKDAKNNQVFGAISYFTTQNATQEGSQTPAPTSQAGNNDKSIVEKVKDNIANEVIEQSISKDASGSGSADIARGAALNKNTPLMVLASSIGIDKLAWIVLGIFTLMLGMIGFLAYKATHKVHKQIKQRFTEND